jgi:hypothetical protein
MDIEMNTSGNTNRWLLLATVMLAGVIVGMLIFRRGGAVAIGDGNTSSADDNRRWNNSRTTNRNRTGINLVFGNIVIGSNNGDENSMVFGHSDSGDND